MSAEQVVWVCRASEHRAGGCESAGLVSAEQVVWVCKFNKDDIQRLFIYPYSNTETSCVGRPWWSSVYLQVKHCLEDFPGGSVDRYPLAIAQDMGFILGQEDFTCFWATKAMHQNCWVCALEPTSCNDWSVLAKRPCSGGDKPPRREAGASQRTVAPAHCTRGNWWKTMKTQCSQK